MAIDNLSIEDVRNGAQPVSSLDDTAGIYFLIDKGEVVYVGQSLSPYGRLQTHAYTRAGLFDSYFVFHCNRDDLNDYEASMIVKFRPKYNSSIPVCRKYTLRSKLSFWYGLRNPLVDELIGQGLITPIRVGRHTVFSREEVEGALQYVNPSKLFKPGCQEVA